MSTRSFLSSLMQFFTRRNLCSINYPKHLDLAVEAGVKEVVKQSHWNVRLMELGKVWDSASTSRWSLFGKSFSFWFPLKRSETMKNSVTRWSVRNGLLTRALRDFTFDWIRGDLGLRLQAVWLEKFSVVNYFKLSSNKNLGSLETN